MWDNKLGLVAVSILAVGGFLVYKEYDKKKKESAPPLIGDVDTIVEGGKAKDKVFLSTLGAGYVKAWADAVRGSLASFVYNGKTYNTQGGKFIK